MARQELSFYGQSPSEEIGRQLNSVSKRIGETITPPSLGSGSVGMSLQDFEDKFPLRFRIFSNVQRAERRGITFSERAIQKAAQRLHALNSLDEYITNHYATKENRILRERQIAAFSAIRDFLERGGAEGYIDLPSGIGKTVIFTELSKAINLETLVVVPTIDLVEQTEGVYKRLAEDFEVGKVYKGRKNYSKQITVVTYQSFVNDINRGILDPEEYDLLILDEAHESLSSKRSQAVDQFKDAIKIGFSATSGYSEDRHLKNLLNTEIYSMPIKDAVEEGLLSPFRVWIAKTTVNLSNVRIFSTGEYSEEELERAINTEGRNRAAVDLYRQAFEGKSAFVFCLTIRHAQEVARLFKESGVSVEAVYSTMSPNDRTRIVEQFRKGQISVVSNVLVFNQGFDVPQASVCLNLRPTFSQVVAKQRGGRVLRNDPENPYKEAIIVDFVDKDDRQNRLPITFAEVTGHAIILGKSGGTHSGSIVDRESIGVGPRYRQIDVPGLEVVVDVDEVMRLTKSRREEILPVQDTDFSIIQENLTSLFVGRYKSIQAIAERVLNYLKEENENFVAQRSSHSHVVTVVVDKERFIQEMVKNRAELKKPELLPIQNSDFPITTPSVKSAFEGGTDRVYTAALKILAEVKEAEPELIALRTSGKRTVEVITDRQKVIDAMIERGFRLKDKSILSVQENDVRISERALRHMFRGDSNRVTQIAREIAESLESEGVTAIRKSSRLKTVRVVTDRGKFIQEMLNRGIKLKDVTY